MTRSKSLGIQPILIIASIALSLLAYGYYYKKDADRQTCLVNMNSIKKALQSYQGCHYPEYVRYKGNPNALMHNMSRKLGFIIPNCPSGGTYTIHLDGPQGTAYATCSCAQSHGHKPQ